MAQPGRSANGKFTVGNRAARRRARDAGRFYYRPATPGPRPPSGTQTRYLPWAGYETHPERALTPWRMNAAWQAAEQGYLGDQCDMLTGLVEGDATLRNLFEQRRAAVASKPRGWQADGAEGDSKIAAAVLDRAMQALPLTAALDHQLTFNQYGFACTEIVWDYVEVGGERYVAPVDLINVPHRRFRVDPETQELRLMTAEKPEGEELVPGKWWITVSPGCSIARGGLGRTAGPYAMYKRWGTRDWVIYSEKFGVPLVLVKIPHNATPELKETAQSIIANIGTDGGAVIEVPEDRTIDVEIVKTDSADSTHTSASLITYCNREMSKLINGSTLTNDNADSGGASYALGEVHASTRWETVQADAAWIQESQRAAIAAPFVMWNRFRPDTRPPCLEIQIVRDLEPAALLDAATKAIAMGIDVSATQIRRAVGLRPPVGSGDSVLALMRAVTAAPEQVAAERAQGAKPAASDPESPDKPPSGGPYAQDVAE